MCPGRSLIEDSNHLLSFFSKVSHPLWGKAAKSLQTLGLPRFVVSYTCFGGLGQGFGRCFVGRWLNMVMGHKRKLDSCQLVSQWNVRGLSKTKTKAVFKFSFKRRAQKHSYKRMTEMGNSRKQYVVRSLTSATRISQWSINIFLYYILKRKSKVSSAPSSLRASFLVFVFKAPELTASVL